MPELIGSFFGLKVITLLCLTVFLGNYSVIKKIHVFNGGLKVRSVICYGVGGLQIPWFDRSNLFLRRISNPSGRLAGCETAGGGMNDISGEAE